MVDGIDEECNELAEVNVCEPGSLEKLRSSVNEVCCEYLVDDAFFVCLVEVVDTFCEETESNSAEYLTCTAVLISRAMSIMESPEEIMSSTMRISMPSTESPRNSCATIGFLPLTTLV